MVFIKYKKKWQTINKCNLKYNTYIIINWRKIRRKTNSKIISS